MTLLSVQDLALNFALPGGLLSAFSRNPKRSLEIFSDVSFSLNTGETLGLVGESGSGKTTLARALLGLTPITQGQIHFAGKQRASRADFATMRANTAMMFQDAIASLSPRMTIGAVSYSHLDVYKRQDLPAPMAGNHCSQTAKIKSK